MTPPWTGPLGAGRRPGRAPVAPLSTAIGALVWNALVAEVAYLRAVAGAEPAFFISQNVPGGDEASEALVSRYQPRNRFYG